MNCLFIVSTVYFIGLPPFVLFTDSIGAKLALRDRQIEMTVRYIIGRYGTYIAALITYSCTGLPFGCALVGKQADAVKVEIFASTAQFHMSGSLEAELTGFFLKNKLAQVFLVVGYSCLCQSYFCSISALADTIDCIDTFLCRTIDFIVGLSKH